MKLNPEHRTRLEEIIDIELQVQENLVRARAAAAEQLVEHFEATDPTQQLDDAQVRAATRLTARPFQPFMTLLRIAAQTEARLELRKHEESRRDEPEFTRQELQKALAESAGQFNRR